MNGLKKWLISLFSQDSTTSMMRLMSLTSLVFGMILAYHGMVGYEVFVLSAFGGKLAQKVAELKGNKDE